MASGGFVDTDSSEDDINESNEAYIESKDADLAVFDVEHETPWVYPATIYLGGLKTMFRYYQCIAEADTLGLIGVIMMRCTSVTERWMPASVKNLSKLVEKGVISRHSRSNCFVWRGFIPFFCEDSGRVMGISHNEGFVIKSPRGSEAVEEVKQIIRKYIGVKFCPTCEFPKVSLETRFRDTNSSVLRLRYIEYAIRTMCHFGAMDLTIPNLALSQFYLGTVAWSTEACLINYNEVKRFCRSNATEYEELLANVGRFTVQNLKRIPTDDVPSDWLQRISYGGFYNGVDITRTVTAYLQAYPDLPLNVVTSDTVFILPVV